MAWRIPPAIQAAIAEANRLWPNRNKNADGTIGDPAHASRTSDHNPDERGVVLAFDLTHDPARGADCDKLASLLVARKDRRVKYIIWNRRIWNPSISDAWRPYSGSNAHTKHMHVSVLRAHENDTSPWWTEGGVVVIAGQEVQLTKEQWEKYELWTYFSHVKADKQIELLARAVAALEKIETRTPSD